MAIGLVLVCTVVVLVPASLSPRHITPFCPLLAPPYDSVCPVPDAPVHATGASAAPFPPVPLQTSPYAVKLYTRPALIPAGFSFVCVPSGGPSALLPLCSPFPSLPLTPWMPIWPPPYFHLLDFWVVPDQRHPQPFGDWITHVFRRASNCVSLHATRSWRCSTIRRNNL